MAGVDELELDYFEALRQVLPLLSKLQRDMLAALAAAPENEMSGGQLAR